MGEEFVSNREDSSNGPESPAKRPLHKIFNPYTMSALVVGNVFWGYNIFRRINRLLAQRYSNPVYQLRRPDSLSNRLMAFKYFIIGGSIVPIAFLGYVLYEKRSRRQLEGGEGGELDKSGGFLSSVNSSLSKYATNSSQRLENLSRGVRSYVPESNFRGMGADLKKDVNKLKLESEFNSDFRSLLSNIF